MALSIELGKRSDFFCFAKGASSDSVGLLPSELDVEAVDVLLNEADGDVLLWSGVRFLYSFGITASSAVGCLKRILMQLLGIHHVAWTYHVVGEFSVVGTHHVCTYVLVYYIIHVNM